MGRTEPTVVVPPQSFRRDARAKKARATINQAIPALLNSSPRARRGIDAAELIVDPPAPDSLPQLDTPKSDAKPRAKSQSKAKRKSRARDEDSDDNSELRGGKDKVFTADVPEKPPTQLRLQVADTLEAAARLNGAGNKRARVGVLSMASPLRPGGGVLNGATSQEEWLCLRTTLYSSLREEFYRLPEVGAIYTPDVLVFRTWDDEASDLDKKDRFFIDVISAGMLRFPDVEGGEGEETKYANAKDRELVLRKMRAVMRILRLKGINKVVLGAWGCGAYGNPIGEIARAWRAVLFGTESKKKAKSGCRNLSEGEGWDGLEIVFSIKDLRMARAFATAFGPGITYEEPLEGKRQTSLVDVDGSQAAINEMVEKIAELEIQVTQARVPDLKVRLGTVLGGLKKELALLRGFHSQSDDLCDNGSVDSGGEEDNNTERGCSSE
ncbi:hypothetical protein B0J12DRAFT_123679 [Macrophomina phaseolina]|uniref:Microbial-type PARG catalytic domain-containing protein n=1 Tax=Macrophomina phaseolina TaxID=35725 RepID=A0ABQ8GAS1_9PEZI|nr:hypothetical protein B0J12DRAFT_123679 [Macrophomina phaseolina]